MSNEIVPVFYNGQKVLTNNQVAEILKCSTSTVRANFKYLKEYFVEGVDYFFLEKEKLAEFKAEQAAKNSCAPAAKNLTCPLAAQNFTPPFSEFASSLYLWTKSGVEKLTKSICTDEAKFIYSSLKFGYFQKTEQNHFPPQIAAPSNKFEVVDRLIKIAELTADKNFKETLLKRAAELI